MVRSRPHVVIVGGGIGGLFAANALIAHGLEGVGLRAGCGARGDRGRRVPDAQQRTPSAKDRTGTGSGEMGRACRSRSCYFRHDGAPIAPVQVTDSSGWNATFGMHRADLVAMLADASAGRRRPHRTPVHRLRAGWRPARVSFADGGCAKPTLSSRRTASTPSFGLMCVRRRRSVFSGSVAYRGLVPHERVPHWPIDRWQMWLGTENTSWPFRYVPENSSTMSGSCRPTRR